MASASSGLESFDNYSPPAANASLFATYCDECTARKLCGEWDKNSACSHPDDYDSQDFHPATTAKRSLLAELLLPSHSKPWQTFSPPLTIVIAKDTRPTQSFQLAIAGPSVFRMKEGAAQGRIAVLTGRDDWIHRLWRRRGNIGPALVDGGFSAVIPPGFSTYWKSPVLEGMVSLKRTAAVASDLQRYLPVVPTLVWRNKKDLERFSEWLGMGGVSCVAVHLGMRGNQEWEWHLRGLRLLQSLTNGSMHLVAIGPSTTRRIKRIVATWSGPLTIASHRPWQLAQQGLALNSGLRFERDWSFTRQELIELNTQSFVAAVERIRAEAH